MNDHKRGARTQHHRGRPFRGKRLKTVAAEAGVGPAAAGGQGGRAHRQGDGARGACLAARGRGLDRGGAGGGQRREDHARRRSTSPPTDKITVDGKPLPQKRAHAAVSVPQAARPRHHLSPTPTAARPSSARCRTTCRAWSASAGSTSTPRGCCCSPTTAGLPARWNCPRPAGCGATACARTARSRRRSSTGCATASRSTASATARSRRRSTASRAPTSG